jgi:hypothetical protein
VAVDAGRLAAEPEGLALVENVSECKKLVRQLTVMLQSTAAF